MKFLELGTQRKIYNLIAKSPGLHLSKIAEVLNIRISIAEYHLQQMEKDGIISSIVEKGYKRYYIEDFKVGIRDKRILKTRQKIYTLIANNPGLHLSKIADLLNIRISLAEYHLQYMEKDKLISIIREKGYKRYYIEDSGVGSKDKKLLSLFRQETPLKIVLFLLKHPQSKHKEIADNLGLSTSTLSYHLNKLVRHGIVSEPVVGEVKGYNIINKKEISAILRRYQLQRLIEKFTETWDDFY